MLKPAAPSSSPASSAGLKPVMGFWAIVLFGVGDILGAGIYGLVGKVAGLVGPAAWLSFLSALIVAALTGLTYAELTSRIPRSAGAAAYTQDAFGRKRLSRCVGFLVVFSGIVSMAAASHAFAGYFAVFAGGLPKGAVLAGFFVLLTVINLRGIRDSSIANIVCTMIELTGLLIVIAAGWRFLGQTNVLEVVPAPEISVPAALLQGGVLAFYAFIGFEDMVNVAEEVRDARRVLPWAILTALTIASSLYILITIIAVSAVPYRELAASGAPLTAVVAKGFPNIPPQFFSGIAVFAVANTALLNFVMGSRVLYGMSSQGLLPGFLSKVHAATGTPRRSILLVGALGLLLAATGSFTVLAQSTSVILLSVFLLLNLALLALKRKTGKSPGTFTVPWIVPALGAASCGALLLFAKP
ncbi:MAG: amino acid permease, partial [Candidatus Omnitrophica bacterium]|nr:amino acid permease [Candidatus Omnitrophota bacterium]